jgi:hypothetical protein
MSIKAALCVRQLKQSRSNSCLACRPAPAGEVNGSWKGGRTRHEAGYVMVRVPGHPRAGKCPYIFEHVLVAEAGLGRHVYPGESIHHRNGIRDDHRPENLELWTRPQPSGIRVSDAIAWAYEIPRSLLQGRAWHTSRDARLESSSLGGAGIRTRVFRDVSGASPSAAGERVLGAPPLTGGCDVPSPAVVSRQATGPVLAVSRSS